MNSKELKSQLFSYIIFYPNLYYIFDVILTMHRR